MERSASGRARAHPRSRGENGLPRLTVPPCAGSSPLTRGKRVWERRAAGFIGLIPAHAGKTYSNEAFGPPGGAHPRSRGENSSGVTGLSGVGGSSPLTRGKPDRSRRSADREWLIPAHAGKTEPAPSCWGGDSAHPRSRGENETRSFHELAHRGSSPLTRGKHSKSGARWGVWGLIPAHAGKTTLRLRCVLTAGAHPRSRGENATRGSR